MMIRPNNRYIPILDAVREQRKIFERLLAEIDEGLQADVIEKKRSFMTGDFWIIESIDGGAVYDVHTPTGIDGFRSTYETALERALELANAEIERLRNKSE